MLKINIENHVIATGGSAVYSDKAMSHLKEISTILFLEVSFEELNRRISNFATRGIAKAENQTFEDLFQERQILYEKYADTIIRCDGFNQEELSGLITESVKESL